ncbi:MAG: hypothetical protein J7M08_10700 [Planctomycetes bacterium]|nr:hypothetical protein [Planctomycetota bacterium]
MFGRNRFLGLALEERRILAAVVQRTHGEECALLRAATFVFPEGASWHTAPAELGLQLGAWLREQEMTGRALIGLPARWLLSAKRQVPPVDEEARVGLLRLAAEEAFSLPAERMVCDFCADLNEGGDGGTALIVGTTRERLRAVQEAMASAGVKVSAVTSTGAVLALASSAEADAATALLCPDGVEVALVSDGTLHALGSAPLAAGEAVDKVVELALRSVLASAGRSVERIDICDSLGLGRRAIAQIAEAAGLQAPHPPSIPVAGLNEADIAAGVAAPPAALALTAACAGTLPFDLTRPRLARRPPRNWRHQVVRVAIILLVASAVAAALLSYRAARKADIASLQARLDEMAPSIAEAKGIVQTVEMARKWYERRPPILDCLVNITEAFPQEGRIWVTSLDIQEGARGVIVGKATDEESILDVLDKLKEAEPFTEEKLLYIRQTRAGAAEKAFAIAFTYAERS